MKGFPLKPRIMSVVGFKSLLFWAVVASLGYCIFGQQLHEVFVTYEGDGPPVSSDCLTNAGANSQCNLRSAWWACSELSSLDNCLIILPNQTSHSLDGGTYGSLVLSAQRVQIVGNGATIRSVGGAASGELLIESFPSGYLEYTSSGLFDYTERCLLACHGEIYRFSACEGDQSQDTYFRLYTSGMEVAANDDFCGSASEITYTYAGDTCEDLCLHVGCYSDSACSATVNIYQQFSTPRFIEYVQANLSATAHLSLVDLTIAGFGGDTSDGGAMYLNGPVFATFQHVTFESNIGHNGGALWMGNNALGASFDHVVINGGTAASGGGFYFDQHNQEVSISNSLFSDCAATSRGGGALRIEARNSLFTFTNIILEKCSALNDGGGAISMGDFNTDFTFTNTTLDDCTAAYGGGLSMVNFNQRIFFSGLSVVNCHASQHGGGGMYLSEQNSELYFEDAYWSHNTATVGMGAGGALYMYYLNTQVAFINVTMDSNVAYEGGAIMGYYNNDDLTITGCTFTDNVARRSGGAVYLYGSHNNIRLTLSVFRDCAALTADGGAIYAFSGSYNFYADHVHMDNCTAKGYGGGMYIDSGNNYAIITDMTLSNCAAGVNGGGMYLYSNMYTTISNSIFDRCTANKGGGIHMEVANVHAVITGVIFQSCAADSGGGIMMVRTNENAEIVQSVFSDCHATSGGGIYLETQNNHLQIAGSTFTQCSASSGGGIYSQGTTEILLLGVHMTNNSAVISGGGVHLGASNEDVRVVDGVFRGNRAGRFGGGIFSATSTTGLAIVGSQLVDNVASGSGGAMAVQGGNRNLIITDLASAMLSAILETPHPYEYQDIVFERHVEDPDALEFILQFDPLTKVGPEDFVVIYGPSDGTGQYGPELFHSDHNDGFPGIDAPCLRIAPNFTVVMYGMYDFYNPPVALSDNFYGFKLYIAAVVPNPAVPTIFSRNRANDRGGAVYLFSSVEFAVVVNTHFERNTADSGGGALYLRNAVTGLVMYHCEFTENDSLEDGGAMVVSSASYGWTLKNCAFDGNSAVGDGGAIALVTNNGIDGGLTYSNELTLEVCEFTDNAALRGGAIYADKENALLMTGCAVLNNIAQDSGGGVLVSTLNVVALQDCMFAGNKAIACGGAITSLQGNALSLQNTSIVANSAGTNGGALCFVDYTETALSGVLTMSDNTASNVGGAVASFSSPLWTLANGGRVHLLRNRASRGSALYYRDLLQMFGRDLHHHHFERNVASVGGTVYWIQDSVMTAEPAGLSSSSGASLQWTANVAPYGKKYATQAVKLLGPDEYQATVFGKVLSPPMSFSLFDFYGQEMPLGGPTSIVASILGANANQCSNRFPYLSGTGIDVVVANGTAVFDALEVQCAPDGALTLNFQARLVDLVEISTGTLSSYHVSNNTKVTFRSCKAGEVIKDGMCIECPLGSYSFADTVTVATQCQDCLTMSGVDTCYADQIVIRRGYWRRFPDSVAVLDCFNDINGCEGGNGTGISLCREGYSGALCAVCADGYFKEGQLCSQCGEEDSMSPATAFYIALISFAVAIILFFVYTKFFDNMESHALAKERMTAVMSARDEEQQADDGSSETSSNFEHLYERPPSLRDKIKAWFQKEYNTIRVKLKIVITTYQILSSIPTTTNVEFPGAFAKFLNTFDVFNLNIVSTIPFSCAQTFTFIDKLIFTTLSPMILSALLFLIFVCDVICQVRHPFQLNGDEAKIKKLMMLKDKYLTYFFFLTYLVLPSVSTTIFQTFLCTNVDPSGEDDASDDYFLTADMSISCTSDYYRRGVAYAIVMLLIYVVGIPTMYFVLLYYNREEIRTRDDVPHSAEMGTQTMADDWLSADFPDDHAAAAKRRASRPHHHHETIVMSARAARLAFLWDAYEPQFWYWEVVETTRRLMLTAVLSVCGTGTSIQSIFAVLLGLLYIKLYGFFEPYVLDNDDIIAESGQFQIFFSFLGALIYQKSLLGSDWNIYVSVALILINLVVAVIFVYYGFQTLAEEMQSQNGELSEKEEREVLPTIVVAEEHTHHPKKRSSHTSDLSEEDQWLHSHPYQDIKPHDEPCFSADVGTSFGACDYLMEEVDGEEEDEEKQPEYIESGLPRPQRHVDNVQIKCAPISATKERDAPMHEFLIQSLRSSLQEKSQELALATRQIDTQQRDQERKDMELKSRLALREQKIEEMQRLLDQLQGSSK